MKVNLECVLCHQRQSLRIIRTISDSPQVHERALREVIAHLSEAPWDTDPMTMVTGVYKILNRITGDPDPYNIKKRQSNEEVLRLYPDLQQQIRDSEDPLFTACKFAVAGNIMDFSIKEHVNIQETLQQVLNMDFAINHYPAFKAAAEKASSLLLFADNAGEIVFDRLLIDTIQDHHALDTITLVVKEIPILNDATPEDVKQVGLTDYANVCILTVNGWNNGQAHAAWMHPEAQSLIQRHDLAISKGQANYEIMNELRGLFLLLMAKCETVGNDTGTYNGALILKYNA
jgi:uncharacterized protein with ATP-grasp and redox domains